MPYDGFGAGHSHVSNNQNKNKKTREFCFVKLFLNIFRYPLLQNHESVRITH